MENLFRILIGIFLIVPLVNCNSQHKNNMATFEHTNDLINETSPYLLQHAHNPVNWRPWGDAALAAATKENKPLLISIGYSACHWCHVMEHESFEDSIVAKLMNDNFICIKVDREERPDVDQVYMEAVQLLSGRGGWPLNCFALPNGKPFYGGTYFRKDQWMSLLAQVSNVYQTKNSEIVEQAENLTQGIQTGDLALIKESASEFKMEQLEAMVAKWKGKFDLKSGGPNKAPKFPLPNNYEFLLQYGHLTQNEEVLSQVQLTLDKMARGGIYDQIGGGFARYSTDKIWKAPHFEKMLYDNAQLIGLYSQAYRKFKTPLYKTIVDETIAFCELELSNGKNYFFSALDADSEGEEGKYYVWKNDELKSLLGDDYDLYAEYYQIGKLGLWEHGNNILMRVDDEKSIADKYELTELKLDEKVQILNDKLFKIRDKRIHPGLDDKTLTSWNAMMITAYCEAHKAIGNESYLTKAEGIVKFILETQRLEDGGLYHSYKKGKSTIVGYLEDYCFVIEGLINLYQVTGNEQYLNDATSLTNYCFENFYDDKSKHFFFTSKLGDKLVARKVELTDNVIAASNSVMAKNLFALGSILDNEAYKETSRNMLLSISEQFTGYPESFSNWAQLYLNQLVDYYEIAVATDKIAVPLGLLYENYYIPNAIVLPMKKGTTQVPLLENKFVKGQSTIYVCVNKSCQLPVTKIEEAIKQITTPVN